MKPSYTVTLLEYDWQGDLGNELMFVSSELQAALEYFEELLVVSKSDTDVCSIALREWHGKSVRPIRLDQHDGKGNWESLQAEDSTPQETSGS